MPGSRPLSSFAACSPATKSSKSEKRPSHLCRQHSGEFHHGYGMMDGYGKPRLGWEWSGVHGVGVGRGSGRGTAALVLAGPQSFKEGHTARPHPCAHLVSWAPLASLPSDRYNTLFS